MAKKKIEKPGQWENVEKQKKPMPSVQIPEGTWNSFERRQRETRNPVELSNEMWAELAAKDEPKPAPGVQLSNEPWGDIGVLDPVGINQFLGVSSLDKFTLPDGMAVDMDNFSSRKFPALSVRPGFSILGAGLTPHQYGLGVWKDNELHVLGNGEWRRWNPVAGTWDLLSSGISNATWSFTNFQGNFADINLLAACGSGKIKRYNGVTVSDLANSPTNVNYIDSHDNRVYAATGNTIKYSALRKADDWTTVDEAGEIVVETPDGEKINGLKAGAGHILVFKPSSVHELYGTGPHNFQMTPVADDIGLLANQAVVSVGGVLYWADQNGIYEYTGGARPDKQFSLPVQGYIDQIREGSKHKTCAGTDGERLYMGLPIDTAGWANIILEYDPKYGIWSKWQRFRPHLFVNMKNELYFLERINDTSDYRVVKFGGNSDDGTPISFKWESKPFGGSSLARHQSWYRMWIVADVPTGCTLDVYLSKEAEGDNWTKVQSVPASVDLQSARVIIPVETVANANWVRVKFEGTGRITIHEIDYQLREMPWR